MMNIGSHKITGFVLFPSSREDIKVSTTSTTLVYLIAFNPISEELSNVRISVGGDFCGDDFSTHQSRINSTTKDIIDSLKKESNSLLFKRGRSINLLSSSLIGWSDLSFANKSNANPWVCTFKDLTNEGKKLYYSFRKLHNESDIRLITLNN